MDGGAEMLIGNYKLGKVIGHGCFGKVRIAQHLPTGHKVAIKILNRQKIKQMKMEDKVRREIKVLRVFMHPHIVRLYEVVETSSDIYVVMEYAESGDLSDYIIIQKDRLPEDQARKFFQQIICGVEYCHRNMVVHRDLKPDNLLLNSKGNVKIADFGLCNIMRDGHPLTTSCGSPLYAAPEVVSGKPYAGPEVDVWSCGVTLYALLCAHLPFEDDNIPNLFKKIKGGIYSVPRHVSGGARDLIKGMLVVDPMKRLTIPAIRQHPWFRLHLPPYLAVPPPLTNQQQNKIIDEEVLQELVNKGFNKNQLVESLQNNIQNEGTVGYSLLLDNKLCDSNGYLGLKFQESMDLDFNHILSREVVSSVVGPCSSSSMNNPRVSLRPQFADERKWALGLQGGEQSTPVATIQNSNDQNPTDQLVANEVNPNLNLMPAWISAPISAVASTSAPVSAALARPTQTPFESLAQAASRPTPRLFRPKQATRWKSVAKIPSPSGPPSQPQQHSPSPYQSTTVETSQEI